VTWPYRTYHHTREYLVGGACYSGAWIAAGALVGIDLEQE
jgi:hypothetical protein